jgi:hypothetical protein
MATVPRERLVGCDGFRVESPEGLLGWVEETWLGPNGEPAALAIRTVDGRRALLLSDELERAVPESCFLVVRRDAHLLELDVPRVEVNRAGRTPVVSASWATTGETLDAPASPGLLARALLALRPWRLAPPPRSDAERPLLQLVAILYTVVTMLVVLVIALAFLVAWIAAGRAY